MTRCADSTKLRTHLDHPDPALEAHLDTCETCSGLLRSAAADFGFVKRVMAALDPTDDSALPDVDIEAALSAVLAKSAPEPLIAGEAISRTRAGWMGRGLALSGAAVLMILVGVFTPTGRSAVADALDAFRGDRLQVVTVDVDAWAASVDSESLLALEELGEVDVTGLAEPAIVVDVTEAEAVAGISAPRLLGTPARLIALAPGTVRLVLASDEGNGVPVELDGSVLSVDIPGAIGAIYASPNQPPDFVIARSGQLVMRSEGASLDSIRSFLLALEELPAGLRDQLSAIAEWRSTIPVPVPVDGPGWKNVEVAGRPAIAFGDDSGLGAIVLRQDPDAITVVFGRIGVSRALELAAGA